MKCRYSSRALPGNHEDVKVLCFGSDVLQDDAYRHAIRRCKNG